MPIEYQSSECSKFLIIIDIPFSNGFVVTGRKQSLTVRQEQCGSHLFAVTTNLPVFISETCQRHTRGEIPDANCRIQSTAHQQFSIGGKLY